MRRFRINKYLQTEININLGGMLKSIETGALSTKTDIYYKWIQWVFLCRSTPGNASFEVVGSYIVVFILMASTLTFKMNFQFQKQEKKSHRVWFGVYGGCSTYITQGRLEGLSLHNYCSKSIKDWHWLIYMKSR